MLTYMLLLIIYIFIGLILSIFNEITYNSIWDYNMVIVTLIWPYLIIKEFLLDIKEDLSKK